MWDCDEMGEEGLQELLASQAHTERCTTHTHMPAPGLAAFLTETLTSPFC